MSKFGILPLIFMLLTGILTGCNRHAGPPPPLAAEQIPSEFNKIFAKASQAAKELSTGVAEMVQRKNYPAAYDAVQALMALPDLSKDQQMIAARALLTINGLLQAAQSQGDQKAAEVLRVQRSNR
jgi:hypothetical protein